MAALFEDGSYSSLAGIALIAKVLAGKCEMQYTRVAFGSGYMTEGQNPKELTEVAGYVMDGKIANITNPVNGECQVTVQINSDDVEEGFYCTGILLYASDPDEGEVPYTYLVLENGPEWIRPSSSVVGKLATFDLIAAVGAVDKVSASIDPNSLATREVVEQLISEAVVRREITIPAKGWNSCTGLEEAEQVAGDCVYFDLEQEDVEGDHVPAVSIYPQFLETATACGLLPVANCLDGKVRFFAATSPGKEIKAQLVLVRPSVGFAPSGPGSLYTLPIATADTLGGVKIGDGIGVTVDGTISADASEAVAKQMATQEEIDALLAEIE